MTVSLIEAYPLGDSAITVRFGTQRSAELLARIHAAAAFLAGASIEAVEDVVPTYLSVTVFYDSLRRSYADISAEIVAACSNADSVAETTRAVRKHVIPVRYDGVDLHAVAELTKLSVEDVISRHTGRGYRVDILGFVPGFAYLSELDEALVLPRRAEPRPRVSAGSVAIAGVQTAVYPLATPGGWHIIGTTDTVMFDPNRPQPSLLRAGDTVRFERVT
ncbi:MAG TPA: 5-oxoprolinase subunit PxpB [Gemmatimonadaceae bacterium]|nr:5-oxoprolinase subunit PxpB [Gemmatimonadaceae bacterium]